MLGILIFFYYHLLLTDVTINNQLLLCGLLTQEFMVGHGSQLLIATSLSKGLLVFLIVFIDNVDAEHCL